MVLEFAKVEWLKRRVTSAWLGREARNNKTLLSIYA
jgi:hypothetical protein